MTWSGWQVGDPQFWLWGHQPAITEDRKGRSAALKEWLANRSGANAYILTPESMEAFARAIERQPKGLLWSYVSSTYRFAQFLQERGGHRLQLQAAFTAGEPLFESQRTLIKEVLGCPVFNSYSSIDTGDIACECEHHQGLHMLTRNCYLEVLQDGQAVPDGQAGEFVLTNLTNYGMPLIRYKLEDWGKKKLTSCPCGRGLPLLDVVEGRKIDLFKTRDGRTVYATFANKTMLTLGGVKQFQIIQKSLDLIVFRIVQDAPIAPNKLQDLEQYTRTTFGDTVNVRFEFVDSLPSSPTGKHRYLVSEVEV
jgi:phenylacetate-CoA ligase